RDQTVVGQVSPLAFGDPAGWETCLTTGRMDRFPASDRARIERTVRPAPYFNDTSSVNFWRWEAVPRSESGSQVRGQNTDIFAIFRKGALPGNNRSRFGRSIWVGKFLGGFLLAGQGRPDQCHRELGMGQAGGHQSARQTGR